jgi:signal transduction histidine kinase
LWLTLASLFVFPAIILVRGLESIGVVQSEPLNYIYAALLAFSLWLFPLVWRKVRDVGDQVLYHDFYQYNRSLHDLSAALTRLQGLDQICSFLLPHLITLLNASDIALLVRTLPKQENTGTSNDAINSEWRIYRQDISAKELSPDRLLGVARLALTHIRGTDNRPLLLDNVLLLGLYDGEQLTGFLCLGPKKNFEPYNRQDRSFLATLVAQLSVLEVNNRYLSQAQADAQKLSALNHRVISAQEDERKHLALELHDEALQQAMLLVRQLSDASTMTEVAEVMPLARSVVSSLRRTCLELRPPLLDELGLEEALRWLARDTEKRGKLSIQVLCKEVVETRPSPSIELALYRVVQEALSNVIKHANAHNVVIQLHQRACGEISLLIIDDGRGFQRRSPLAERLGLVSMQERMESIGGHIAVRTSPGRGVTLRATYRHNYEAIPIVEQQQEVLL